MAPYLQERYYSGLRARSRRYFPLFLCLGLVAFGLLAAGCGTRGWLIMEFETLELKSNLGLWQVEACNTTTDKCVTASTDDATKIGNKDDLVEYQVETCLALAFLFIALVVLACFSCCACKHGYVMGSVYCVFALTFISGILAIVAAGTFGNEVREVHDAYEEDLNRQNSNADNPVKTPYSLILTGVGGFLALILAFVLLFLLRPWKRESRDPPPRAYQMRESRESHVYPEYPPPSNEPARLPRKPSGLYAMPYSSSYREPYREPYRDSYRGSQRDSYRDSHRDSYRGSQRDSYRDSYRDDQGAYIVSVGEPYYDPRYDGRSYDIGHSRKF